MEPCGNVVSYKEISALGQAGAGLGSDPDAIRLGLHPAAFGCEPEVSGDVTDMIKNLRNSASLAVIALVSGLSVSALTTPAEAQSARTWEGFYLGAHVGYGDMDADGTFNPGSTVDLGDLDMSGVLGGAQLGYNYDTGSVVVGIEADLSFIYESDDAFAPTSTDNASGDLDLLASVRGRVGVPVDQARDVLVYGTLGVAYRKAEVEVFDGIRGEIDTLSQRIDFDDFGPVFGGGVEWAASDRVSLRLEGLYYAFNLFSDREKSITLSAAGSADNVEFGDAWAIRVGVNYRF